MDNSTNDIVSQIAHGSSEQRIAALDAYGKQFEAVIAAATQAMQSDPLVMPFIAERVAGLGQTVRELFDPLFLAAADDELKFMSALVLIRFGNQDALPWLLGVASSPGPLQYDVTRQLARLRIPEVRGMILDQLRSRDLAEDVLISSLLDSWSMFGEQLPDDVRARMHSEDAPTDVKFALKSLNL